MPESQKEIQKMQLDAERRIREMQRRSDTYLRGNEKPPVPNYSNNNQFRHNEQSFNQDNHSNPKNPARQPHKNQQNQPPKQPVQDPPPQQKGGFLSHFKGTDILKIFNFQNLHIDNDVLIIVALIFLLSTEETDELLLLALIYIML